MIAEPDAASPLTASWVYLGTKRLLDTMLGTAALVLSAPIMVVLALLIRLDSTGPALFRQLRVGKGAQTFLMVKFRTMTADNDDTIHQEYYRKLVEGDAEARLNAEGLPVYLLDDPRVTRMGRFLRRTSLDELPNLFNVLAGDMSLVGPRPAITYEVDLYDDRARRRLTVKPGMTGLAQIGGRGGLTFGQMVDFDLDYIARRSLRLDLQILLATPRAVFSRRGV
ncbi:MAG: sugar transferase [Acidimicrobiia bacterium]